VTAEEVRLIPLFIEVIGEPSVGKTHLASLFPKPALVDTTAKGEGYVVFKKFHSDWKRRYFRARTFDDFTKHLSAIERDKGYFRTVVVDTSADLRTLGSQDYIKELNEAGKNREKLMPEEYGWINEKINDFINKITDIEKLCMNLVFTSQMRDEWKDRKPTGRRIRKGYPDANFQSDMRLFLQLVQKVDEKTMQFIPNEYERKCQVIKCRFRDQADKEDWKAELKELNWKGIVELAKLKEGEIVE
jgi:hypothetical protein